MVEGCRGNSIRAPTARYSAPTARYSDAPIPASAAIGDILLAAMDGNSTKVSPRQRARWAIGHTECVDLTHDILPAVGVAVVTYFVTLATAPKGTPIDKWAVGAPLIAGLIALVACSWST